jgi:glycosyltransferase involved in cell wall biosynthesis
MATWRFLFVSTYPPNEGGIAGFTRDLTYSVSQTARTGGEDVARVEIAGIERDGASYRDEPRVSFAINPRQSGEYRRLASYINKSSYDVVCVQHDFSLFPGEAGREVLDLYSDCSKPIVTTLHSVPPSPSPAVREVLRTVVERSETSVVMTQRAADLLRKDYGVGGGAGSGSGGGRIQLIPHGTPEIAFGHRPTLKHQLGLDGRRVIMTFGLLARHKGIEYMIDAMEMVSKQHPDAVYLVIGKNDPKAAAEGDAYREALMQRAERLRRPDSVRFVNRFVSTAEAVAYLQAADVYVTPYLDPDQTTSGTLAYALSAGKAIVSTPYMYAQEVLSDTRGVQVPFRDAASLAGVVTGLLRDPELTSQLERRAYEYARKTHWSAVGRQYLELLAEAGLTGRPLPRSSGSSAPAVASRRPFVS